jgi:hypothetical protein
MGKDAQLRREWRKTEAPLPFRICEINQIPFEERLGITVIEPL